MTTVDLPFSFATRSVFVPDADALVVADLHFGKAEIARVDAPLEIDRRTLDRLEERIDAFEPSTVVVAGDLLHAFDRIPRGVEATVADLVARVMDAGASLVVTRGNHDSMLESVFDGPVVDEYRLDDETIVCHGHERPETDGTRYVVGHEHPALSVEGRKLPCFLYGNGVYEGSDVVICPAFTRAAAGRTVNRLRGSDVQSPLISSTDPLYPAVRDDDAGETLWFPPLGRSRELL